MLSSLSWNIFFTTIALLAVGYYAISTLLLYRGEISLWFKSKTGAPFSRPQAVVKPSSKPPQTDSIIGGISLQDARSDARSSSVSAEDFVIGEDEDDSNGIDQIPAVPMKDDLLIGTIADLLEEIKTVCRLIADTDADKAEAESLLRTLLTRYPNIADGSFRDAVTLYVCKELNERTVLDVSIPEAASWWEEKSFAKK
jgi:hypothetical protein